LVKLVEWASRTPAKMAGLSAYVGAIAPGMHANLVAFDKEATFTLAHEHLHYRHAISPYMGETLRGIVRSTWLRGERVYENRDGRVTFAGTPRGREYALSCSLSR
jgi:allantoinase